MRHLVTLAVFLLVATVPGGVPAEGRNHRAEVGVGFVACPEYTKVIDNAYSDDYDVSGGGAFIEMEGGLAFSVTPSVYISPRLMILYAPTSFGDKYTGSEKATYFFVPQVNGRYALEHLYFGAGLGMAIGGSELSRVDIEGSGISLGLRVGWTFTENFEAELGWQTLPVKVGSGEEKKSKDFGGFALSVRGLFPIKGND